MAYGTAFQKHAFQIDAFQIVEVTSTRMLDKPVDCVLAGDQDYEEGKSPLNVRKGHANYRALRSIFRE